MVDTAPYYVLVTSKEANPDLEVERCHNLATAKQVRLDLMEKYPGEEVKIYDVQRCTYISDHPVFSS